MQLPYVRFPPPTTLANSSPLQELADKLAGLCGAQRFALRLDNAAAALAPSSETFDFFFFPSLVLILNSDIDPNTSFRCPCQP
jgi:hypothetical protein